MINSLPPDVVVQILDTLNMRVFWKDSKSRYLGCNQHFADDAGIADPREFVGKSDYYFYHPDQARAFRADDADVMYTGQPKLRIVEKLTRGDGVTVWLETNKLPLRNEEGKVIGVIGTYEDVTDRRRAELARGLDDANAA